MVTAKTKTVTKEKKETVQKPVVQLIRAEARQVRISPRKVDRVLRLIRGKTATQAQLILKFLPHFGARHAEKVLNSAIANAENNNKVSKDLLTIARAVANSGVMLKRFRAGGKGSAKRIIKYASHIVIELKVKGENK
jgi:large subunit ribosomal protein L22